MRCLKCMNEDSKVIDSRLIDNGRTVRRRRECTSCGARFTTHEVYMSAPIMVHKRNGETEPFDHEKLRAGIMSACSKRDIERQKIEEVVNDIEREVRNMQGMEVKAEFLGEIVLERLKELDEVAYMRFASVYKDFDEAASFIKEARSLDRK